MACWILLITMVRDKTKRTGIIESGQCGGGIVFLVLTQNEDISPSLLLYESYANVSSQICLFLAERS